MQMLKKENLLLKNYFGMKNKIFNNLKLKQGNLF